jgi:hypothetical protein
MIDCVKLSIDLVQTDDGRITGWLYAPPPDDLLSVEKGIHSSDVISALTRLGISWLKLTNQRGYVTLRKDIVKKRA